jgi:hypothetical protein
MASSRDRASHPKSPARAISTCAALQTGELAKLNPIIRGQLGEPPVNDPAALQRYMAQAEKITTRMASAPRIAMTLERPVQVTDPNNPLRNTYMPAGEAMRTGAEAPSSGEVKAAGSVQKAFTSGKPAEELTAFRTANAHADLLQQAATAMSNGDTKALNSLKNRLKTEFGSSDVTNFGVIAAAYTREVNAALSKGHISDSDLKEIGGTMPSNASPQQILGAVQAYKSLMQSKLQQRQEQYQQGVQGKPAFGAAQPRLGGPAAQQSAGGGVTAETRSYQGHMYTRNGPTELMEAAAIMPRGLITQTAQPIRSTTGH